MEGPKSFAEKPQRTETGESVESLAESIERAHELLAELKELNDTEVIGGEAMALNSRAEELAHELTETLKQIPAKDCIKYNLPYHPTDIKPESVETPFPVNSKKSGYNHTINYEYAANDGNYPRVDQEQPGRRAA